MSRVFGCLAIAELLVWGAAAVLGFASGFGNVDRHVVLAVFALLLTCLVEIVVFTYLTITGKVIAQAVHLGGLGDGPLLEARGHKRAATYQLAVLVGIIVLVTATGAQSWRLESKTVWHTAMTLLALPAAAWILWRHYTLLHLNAALLNRTLHEYSQRRVGARQGLAGSAGTSPQARRDAAPASPGSFLRQIAEKR